ncbi:hypothetical protein [Pseudomonas putida]
MIEDITTVIKAQLYDRITSPLTGAFLFSWPIWNWKFLVILFSDLKAPEKLKFISETIFTNTQQAMTNGLILPLASAIAILIIYPFPSRLFFWIAQYHRRSMKRIQQRSEDEMPMTIDEAAELRRSFSEIQIKREKEISEMTATISELKEQLNQSEQFLASTSERAKSIDSGTNELRLKISALEQENHEHLTNINHLQGVISSVSPTIVLSQGDDHPNYSGLRKIADNISTEFHQRSESDLGIERSIRTGMDLNGLLLRHSPEIYALCGIIYLRIEKPHPRTYIIGKYNRNGNSRIPIESCLQTLETLNKSGFKV